MNTYKKKLSKILSSYNLKTFLTYEI